MISFWWIMFVIVVSIALWLTVHPLVLPVPLLVWLIVEFIQAERQRKRRDQELVQAVDELCSRLKEEDKGRA